MSAFRQLLVVGSAAFVALLFVAGIIAGIAAVDSATHSNSLLSPSVAATVTFVYTMILGTLPALLVAAPAYLLLMRKGKARWYYVLALGVTPGVIALSMDANLGFWAIVCGGVVSLMTHLVCRRFDPSPRSHPI